MKYIILAILLAGCGIELQTGLPESVEIEVPEIPHPLIKKVNGHLFIYYAGHCIAIDPTVYPPREWLNMVEYDAYRGAYSYAEEYYCDELD